jgi:hypothetical protein
MKNEAGTRNKRALPSSNATVATVLSNTSARLVAIRTSRRAVIESATYRTFPCTVNALRSSGLGSFLLLASMELQSPLLERNGGC